MAWKRKKTAYSKASAQEYQVAWWRGFRRAIYHPEEQGGSDIQTLVQGLTGALIESDTAGEKRGYSAGFSKGLTFASLVQAEPGQWPDIERHLLGGASGLERGLDSAFSTVAEVVSDPMGEAGDALDFLLSLGS